MRLVEEIKGRALDAWRHGAPLVGAGNGTDDIVSQAAPIVALALLAALTWAVLALEGSTWPM